MRAAQFLAIIGRGSKGSNALELTEDRAGATSEQQDNVINTVNSLDPYGPSWQLVPGNVAAGTVYAQVPTSGTGDLAFTRASTATRTNSAGTIVNVATGVPRIDYRNADGSLSSTGRLLLEPQRTNALQFSEQFDNAAWIKNVSVSANAIVSPDGYTNADKLVESASNVSQWAYQSLTLTGAQTISVYAKKGERNFLALATAGLNPCYFNLDTGVVFSTSVGATASITNAGNGWYRCVVTASAAVSPFAIIAVSDNGNRISYAGDITKGIYVWGAQQEAGAYATTYIPTTTAAVTRIADAASKTGVSDLIGQTEGTMFAEVNWGLKAEPGSPVCGILTLNTNVANIQNSIILGIERAPAGTNRVYCFGIVSNVVQFELFSSNIANGNYKIAVGYKQNDFVLYVNGVQIGTDTSGTVTATSQIILGNKFNGDTRVMSDGITQAALFKTRLTNAQLAEITTL
jgi:hypothetical protein